MKAEELPKCGLRQFPMVVGGIVPVVNIAGARRTRSSWSGATLGDIFQGRSRTGTTREIAALNAGLLPARKITVVHRSDGSGTTFNFTNYLFQGEPVAEVEVRQKTTVSMADRCGRQGQ